MNDIASIAAKHLKTHKSLIRVARLNESFTNQVYRAYTDKKSVILKTSNNISSLTGESLDTSHLKLEYLFLKAITQLKVDHIMFPAPLEYKYSKNVLVMSDLGKGKGVLSNLVELDFPRGALKYLGIFLRLIHTYSYPSSLIKLLKKTKIGDTVCRFKFGALSAIHSTEWSYNKPLLNPKMPGLTICDFSPRNCIAILPNLGVHDFDFIAYADQLLDIAHFQAHMFFMIIRGKISKNRLDILNELLNGYFNGDLIQLEENIEMWQTFCQYLAASLYHRFRQEYNEAIASRYIPTILKIYHGSFSSWELLQNFFLLSIKESIQN